MPAVASVVPPEPPAEIMPAQVAPRANEGLEGDGHRRNRATAVAAEHRRFAARVMPRHFARVNARGEGLPLVDRSTVTTRRPSFSRHWRR